jgi:hypothetical protein
MGERLNATGSKARKRLPEHGLDLRIGQVTHDRLWIVDLRRVAQCRQCLPLGLHARFDLMPVQQRGAEKIQPIGAQGRMHLRRRQQALANLANRLRVSELQPEMTPVADIVGRHRASLLQARAKRSELRLRCL